MLKEDRRYKEVGSVSLKEKLFEEFMVSKI